MTVMMVAGLLPQQLSTGFTTCSQVLQVMTAVETK
jgi:hypothetical protein